MCSHRYHEGNMVVSLHRAPTHYQERNHKRFQFVCDDHSGTKMIRDARNVLLLFRVVSKDVSMIVKIPARCDFTWLVPFLTGFSRRMVRLVFLAENPRKQLAWLKYLVTSSGHERITWQRYSQMSLISHYCSEVPIWFKKTTIIPVQNKLM